MKIPLVYCSFLSLFIALQLAELQSVQGRKIGDPITIECQNGSGIWGSGPFCMETQTELSFSYGVDMLLTCAWRIANEKDYEHLAKIILREESWNCRMSIAPGTQFYIPLTIPLMGVVEDFHIHVGNHYNFVFHAAHGNLLGAGVYAVKDDFILIQKGSFLQIHGPVKWFHGHYFQDFTPEKLKAHSSPDSNFWVTITLWCSVSMVLTMITAVLYYRYRLKPSLVRKFLKQD